jgi:hypothetical protein
LLQAAGMTHAGRCFAADVVLLLAVHPELAMIP